MSCVRFVSDHRLWSVLFFHTGVVQVWSQLPNAAESDSPSLPDIAGLNTVFRDTVFRDIPLVGHGRVCVRGGQEEELPQLGG